MDNKINDIIKETNYCKLISSYKSKKDANGYQYAIEKIFVKTLRREEIRLCLYKNMKGRSGDMKSRMLARPVDLTENELLFLLSIGVQNNFFSSDFIAKLRKVGDK